VSGALQHFGLQNTREFSFGDIDLPEGANQHHPKTIVAGITPGGKKVVVFTGRTAAFEVDPDGVETETGHVQPMEAATAYLEMVNRVGAENLILTTAAGGINHPLHTDEPKPFERENLPILGLVDADIMLGYPFFHMGHHKAQMGDFFPLRDADPGLMEAFTQSMAEVEPNVIVPHIYYVSIPALYEDRALAHFLAINNAQVIGMTYGPEKTFLSGVQGIKKFMGIVVVTDKVELCYLNDPDRKLPISVSELREHRPGEFFIKEPASDPVVRKVAALANDRLGRSLANMVEKI
jgi:purine nucleoside phosphorylase